MIVQVASTSGNEPLIRERVILCCEGVVVNCWLKFCQLGDLEFNDWALWHICALFWCFSVYLWCDDYIFWTLKIVQITDSASVHHHVAIVITIVSFQVMYGDGSTIATTKKFKQHIWYYRRLKFCDWWKTAIQFPLQV